MTPKQLAELIVKYHNTKIDLPDPKCGKCNGTGIETWYCGHNGNEEKSPCSCKTRTLRSLENKLYDLNIQSKPLLKICEDYLKNDN